MGNKVYEAHKSSIGDLDANVAAVLPYLAIILIGFVPIIGTLSWAIPVVFFFMEKKNSFVRFHAMQVILLQVVGLVISMMIKIFFGFWIAIGHMDTIALSSRSLFYGGLIGFDILGMIFYIVQLIVLVFCIIAAFKAYKYEIYKIPIIGNLTAKYINLKV